MLKKLIIIEVFIWNIYIVYNNINYYITIPTGIGSNILNIKNSKNSIVEEWILEIIIISIILILWIIFNIIIKYYNINSTSSFIFPTNTNINTNTILTSNLLTSTSTSTSTSISTSISTLGDEKGERNKEERKKERIWKTEINIIIIILIITILTFKINDLFQIFMIIEIMSFCSYVLIFSTNINTSRVFQQNKNIYSFLIYLIISILSSILILIYIILHYINYNSFNIYDYISILSYNLPYNISNILPYNNIPYNNMLIFLLIGILNKIGIMPFHYWVKKIYSNIDNVRNIILMIIPKILYIIIIYNIFGILSLYYSLNFQNFFISNILFFILSYSLIFGAISGIFENNIIKIIASSSFINLSILLIPLFLSLFNNFLFFPLEYLILYSFASICILYFPLLIKNNPSSPFIYNVSNLNFFKFNSYSAWFIIFIVLSLIGIPPLGGFFAKLNILYLIFFSSSSPLNLLLILFILFSTVISISFYIKFIRFYILSPSNVSVLYLFKSFHSYYFLSFLLFFLLFYSLLIPLLYPSFGSILI